MFGLLHSYLQEDNFGIGSKSELVEIWRKIKKDRKDHMHLLKEPLEKEIHG